MGAYGYIGFLDETQGNILRNFPLPYEVSDPRDLISAKAANVARGLVCATMFCVYPLESFVARHVVMTNLFQGREAHEGDDHVVLDRWDRRWATTIALYLCALFPALYFDNVGIVLALTGTVAATTLTYIGPGILFIGVHGQEFLDLVESWGDSPGFFDRLLWYLIFMPFWCQIAKFGKKGLLLDQRKKEFMTPANEYRLGSVRHTREMIRQHKQRRSRDNVLGGDDVCQPESEILLNEAEKTSAELGLITATAEKSISYGSVSNLSKGSEFQREVVETDHEGEDPQDEKQTAADFAVAIIFVFIGAVAFTAGIISIYMK